MLIGILARAHLAREYARAGADLGVTAVDPNGALGGHRSLKRRSSNSPNLCVPDIENVPGGRPHLVGETRPLALDLA